MFPNSYTPLNRASPPTEAYLAAVPSRRQGWAASTMGLICSSAWDRLSLPRVMDKHRMSQALF